MRVELTFTPGVPWHTTSAIDVTPVTDASDSDVSAEFERASAAIVEGQKAAEIAVLRLKLAEDASTRSEAEGEHAYALAFIERVAAYANRLQAVLAARERVREREAKRERMRQRLTELEGGSAPTEPATITTRSGAVVTWGAPR